MKESIQDSMYDNNRTLGRLLDEIGDRLANVVENFENEPSSQEIEIDHIVEVETI